MIVVDFIVLAHQLLGTLYLHAQRFPHGGSGVIG